MKQIRIVIRNMKRRPERWTNEDVIEWKMQGGDKGANRNKYTKFNVVRWKGFCVNIMKEAGFHNINNSYDEEGNVYCKGRISLRPEGYKHCPARAETWNNQWGKEHDCMHGGSEYRPKLLNQKHITIWHEQRGMGQEAWGDVTCWL